MTDQHETPDSITTEVQALVTESLSTAGDVEDPLLALAVEHDTYTPERSMLEPRGVDFMRMNFKRLQEEQKVWADHNFGHLKSDYNAPFKGMVEELGELSHALLKQEQGIRGTYEQHELAAQDAVGDMLVFLSDFCNKKGWDLQEIIETTWTDVKKRNWKRFPKNGINE